MKQRYSYQYPSRQEETHHSVGIVLNRVADVQAHCAGAALLEGVVMKPFVPSSILYFFALCSLLVVGGCMGC